MCINIDGRTLSVKYDSCDVMMSLYYTLEQEIQYTMTTLIVYSPYTLY